MPFRAQDCLYFIRNISKSQATSKLTWDSRYGFGHVYQLNSSVAVIRIRYYMQTEEYSGCKVRTIQT